MDGVEAVVEYENDKQPAMSGPYHPSKLQGGPRLTVEEEKELLRQAVEWRRLNHLEREMALKSPSREMPLISIRAKQAGYGDELDLYEQAKYQGQLARETLVTRNMGLVHFCVQQILQKQKGNRLNSLSRDDLIQEGAIGLARAVDKWNPAIGGRFSTYAVYWIRAAILRCIAERDDVVRVPDHVSRAVREINKAAKRLGMDLDADGLTSTTTSSWREAQMAKRLAEEAGLSDRGFVEAMKARSRRYTGGYVSFDTWMQSGKDLHSDVPMTMQHTDQPGITPIESDKLVEALSKFLRPKEIEALLWRYGLMTESKDSSEPNKKRDYLAEAEAELFGTTYSASEDVAVKGKWGEAMSFSEVGKRMKVSAEYGRRLCHAGLDKLRRAAEEGRLELALLF